MAKTKLRVVERMVSFIVDESSVVSADSWQGVGILGGGLRESVGFHANISWVLVVPSRTLYRVNGPTPLDIL